MVLTRKNAGRTMFSPEVASELAENTRSGGVSEKTVGKAGESSYQETVIRAFGSSGIEQMKSRAAIVERIKEIDGEIADLDKSISGKRAELEDKRGRRQDFLRRKRGDFWDSIKVIASRACLVLNLAVLPATGLFCYSQVSDGITAGQEVAAQGVVIKNEIAQAIERGNTQVIAAVNNITGNTIAMTSNGGQLTENGNGVTKNSGTTTYTFYNVKHNARWLADNAYTIALNGKSLPVVETRVLNSVTKGKFWSNTNNSTGSNDDGFAVIGGGAGGVTFLLWGAFGSSTLWEDGKMDGNPIRSIRKNRKNMAEKDKEIKDLDKQVKAADAQIVARNKEAEALKDQMRELDGA